MAEQAPFAKDFGYLIPFLDKVNAYAEGLPDGPRKDELQSLLSSQSADWTRIAAILSGGAPSAPRAQEAPAEAEVPSTDTAPLAPVETFIVPEGHSPKTWSIGSSITSTPQADPSGAPKGLSVGSLIGVKRSL